MEKEPSCPVTHIVGEATDSHITHTPHLKMEIASSTPLPAAEITNNTRTDIESTSGAMTSGMPFPETAADLLDLVLPSDSPPLQRDLFIKSEVSNAALSKRFGIRTSSKLVMRLEVVIHTNPSKVKDLLSDFGSREACKGFNAVVQERKENGDYAVAYKIQGTEVGRHKHAASGEGVVILVVRGGRV